jgi:hypothetical protein
MSVCVLNAYPLGAARRWNLKNKKKPDGHLATGRVSHLESLLRSQFWCAAL